MDSSLWTPVIKQLLKVHFSASVESIIPGLAGTFPAFIVNKKWVLKFFGRLFAGWQSWRVESAAAQLLRDYPVLPSPRLYAQGEISIEEDLHWWYLIFEFIPGVRIGDQFDHLNDAAKMGFARWLGERVRDLHQIPVTEAAAVIPNQATLFNRMRSLCLQNHTAWQSLPDHLIRQIPSFLETTDAMAFPAGKLSLIHADLTRDHFLGETLDGQWHTHAVIDFGDAILGSYDYELVALHLDLFQMDANLLGSFLAGYQLPAANLDLLPYQAMRATLLHPFNVLGTIPSQKLRRKNWKNLEELAFEVWKVQPTPA